MNSLETAASLPIHPLLVGVAEFSSPFGALRSEKTAKLGELTWGSPPILQKFVETKRKIASEDRIPMVLKRKIVGSLSRKQAAKCEYRLVSFKGRGWEGNIAILRFFR